MDCEKFNRMMDNYENLTDIEMEKLQAHADKCQQCQRELAFMRSIIKTTQTLPELEVPADFMDRLNVRIDEADKKRKVFRHLKRNWSRYSAIAASLAIVAIIGSNSDMLLDRMQRDDDGVIETVTNTDMPDPASDAQAAAQATPDVSDLAEPPIVGRSDDSASASYTQRSVSAPAQDSSVTKRANTMPDPTASVRPAPTSTNVPNVSSTSETAAPTTAVLDNAVTESATAQPSDNGYEIDSSKDSMGYAMAITTNGDNVNKNDGYTIYADGLIIISQSDYREAMDIIIRYVTGIYNSYYFIDTSSLGDMRSELYNAGISFEDYINATSEEITFRIIAR